MEPISDGEYAKRSLDVHKRALVLCKRALRFGARSRRVPLAITPSARAHTDSYFLGNPHFSVFFRVEPEQGVGSRKEAWWCAALL